VTPWQFAEAQKISDIVCVQNMYNVAHRTNDDFIDELGRQSIAYVPFFPLGGFTPLQSAPLNAAAASMQAITDVGCASVAASPRAKILLIPGTSSLKHLYENLEAATLGLPPGTIADLDLIAGGPKTANSA
jgi:pyridoxine 4-dehydrogenase